MTRFACVVVLALGCSGPASPSSAGSTLEASTAANALALVANAGPPRVGYVNGVFTSVKVCVPGTLSCATIDSVLVDTGSIGLRVVSASAAGALGLDLPATSAMDGSLVCTCGVFVDSYTWGSVRRADVVLGRETAPLVPIEVIGDPACGEVPKGCASNGGVDADTVSALGANAVLGVGPVVEDCGAPCAAPLEGAASENPGNVYFACSSSRCEPAAVESGAQVANPVGRLARDNDGVVVDLSAVPADGANQVAGTLYLGIGTRANNGLEGATVLSIDPNTFTFTTDYRGRSYPGSFVDSGSSGYFFLSASASGLPACSSGGYYCPTAPISVDVTNRGAHGEVSAVSFDVENADELLSRDQDFVFDDLAGPNETGGGFDFGLPFFLGRRVFTSIEGTAAPGGATPYFAF